MCDHTCDVLCVGGVLTPALPHIDAHTHMHACITHMCCRGHQGFPVLMVGRCFEREREGKGGVVATGARVFGRDGDFELTRDGFFWGGACCWLFCGGFCLVGGGLVCDGRENVW